MAKEKSWKNEINEKKKNINEKRITKSVIAGKFRAFVCCLWKIQNEFVKLCVVVLN